MAIENLIDRIGADRILLQAVINEIQSHFFAYQVECFFLMLDKIDQDTSQITWFKKFPDIIALRDFVFDTEYRRCCISIKFQNTKYVLLLNGRAHTIEVEVGQYTTEEVYICDAIPNRETVRTTPWDIIEKGFGELSGLILSSDKKPGAA